MRIPIRVKDSKPSYNIFGNFESVPRKGDLIQIEDKTGEIEEVIWQSDKDNYLPWLIVKITSP
jgi:hypothetical protein